MMQHPEICILCLIGLPASGKTQLATLVAANKLDFTEVQHICYDDLINWDENKFLWKEKRNNIFKDVECKIASFISSKKTLNESLLIILDDNMYYRSMRYIFYKLAKKYQIKFCQVYTDIPLVECLKRNCNRVSPLPTDQILNVNEKLESPLCDNNWEKNTLTVQCSESTDKCLTKIRILIESADVEKEYNLNKNLISNTKNSKHIADIALRRIISILASEIRSNNEYKQNMAEKISLLNKRRNEIMNLISKNEIDLPSFMDIENYILHLLPIMSVQQNG